MVLTTADGGAMLESNPVRHRSRATHSRQPRQVRKEATVTGSCVCSGPPVPGFSPRRSLFPRAPPIVISCDQEILGHQFPGEMAVLRVLI